MLFLHNYTLYLYPIWLINVYWILGSIIYLYILSFKCSFKGFIVSDNKELPSWILDFDSYRVTDFIYIDIFDIFNYWMYAGTLYELFYALDYTKMYMDAGFLTFNQRISEVFNYITCNRDSYKIDVETE